MPNLQAWEARTRIESPVVFSAFEEVDGRMMASVRILTAGTSKNRRTYPPAVVKEAADKKLFDGIRMFINHDRKHPEAHERPFEHLVSAIESTSFDSATNSLDGRVEFFDRPFYEKVQRAKDYVGVSINALVKGTRRVMGGQVYEDVSGWNRPRTVDWVTFPAAGGSILAFEDEDEETMIDWTKVTAEEIKKNAPAVFEALEAEAKAELEKEEDENPPKKPEGEQTLVSAESIAPMIAEAVTQVLAKREEDERAAQKKRDSAREKVKAAFDASGLPPRVKARVMAGFEGVEEFDEAAVTESITAAKEELKELGLGPTIRDMGPSGGDAGDKKGVVTFSAHESVKDSFQIKPAKKEQEAAKEGTK